MKEKIQELIEKYEKQIPELRIEKERWASERKQSLRSEVIGEIIATGFFIKDLKKLLEHEQN